jgi:hypothetical protein
MPKIRDLGISVIPVTMRPPEVGGGGADFEYWAQKTGCPGTDPKPGVPPGCQPTNSAPECQPTNNAPGCQPTNQNQPKQNTSAATLPDAAVGQLKQQLHDQINEELLN